jgi:hypothetical protein
VERRQGGHALAIHPDAVAIHPDKGGLIITAFGLIKHLLCTTIENAKILIFQSKKIPLRLCRGGLYFL